MYFRLLEMFDEGHFGKLFKIEDQEGKKYAFKAIPAKNLKYIELDILTRLKSPYIIRTIDPKITSFNNYKGIIEELKDDNLNNLDTNDLSYIQLKRIIISIIYGVRCMHKKGFLHLDISKNNILYSKDQEGNYLAFLTDFGWSVRCDNAYKGIESSSIIEYKNTPIEVFETSLENKNIIYNDKSDIWSIGIVILSLLGAQFKLEDKEKYIKDLKNINDVYIEEKIRLYNNSKMSNQEEIYLKELLVNMLKIKKEDRISSKDINKLKFFKSTNRLLNLSEDCVLEKPKELVFMPYMDPNTLYGIKKIREYYLLISQTDSSVTLEEYFLAQQVFLRLISTNKPSLNEDELILKTEEAKSVASNYYNRNYGGSFELAKQLNGEIGYNYYYYATYIEDLLVLDHYLVNGNEDLLGFYNLFNIEKLYEYFRDKYQYKNIKKNKVTLNEFFQTPIPNEKNNKTINFMTALDYHEIINDEDEEITLLNKYKNNEKDFRTDIINHFEKRIIKLYEEEDLNVIEIIDKMIDNKKYIDNYNNLKKNLLAKNISQTLQNINDYFDYGIIYGDIYGNIETQEKDLLNKKFFLVKNNNIFSLLVRNNNTMIHYYSEKNSYLKNYLLEKKFGYENNFEYGINSCCNILELCLIYIIYYNLKNKEKDYHIKCLDYDTVKSVLLVLMV